MNDTQRIHADLISVITQMGGTGPFAAGLIAQYILSKYKLEEY